MIELRPASYREEREGEREGGGGGEEREIVHMLVFQCTMNIL